MNRIILILFYLTALILIIRTIINFKEHVYVKSDIDNQKYLIRQGNGKSRGYLKDSANHLAEINRRIEILIMHLNKKYPNTDFVKNLVKNYNSAVISEAAIDEKYTTFTIDKREMHICLRKRDSKKDLYNIDLLMYVVIHELAHICNYDKYGNPIQGHGNEFRRIFKILVTEAINIGVYNYIDFTSMPQEYCGIVINTSIVKL
jgi:hypothetical protein